jgi:hypothetical protein
MKRGFGRGPAHRPCRCEVAHRVRCLHSESSSNGFHLGPLFCHAYGLAYVVAVAAAIAITTRRWEARGGDRNRKRSRQASAMRRGGTLLAAGGLSLPRRVRRLARTRARHPTSRTLERTRRPRFRADRGGGCAQRVRRRSRRTLAQAAVRAGRHPPVRGQRRATSSAPNRMDHGCLRTVCSDVL